MPLRFSVLHAAACPRPTRITRHRGGGRPPCGCRGRRSGVVLPVGFLLRECGVSSGKNGAHGGGTRTHRRRTMRIVLLV